ncbi:MAG: hypothetical protein Q8Q60_00205 [Candidatus Chromulinivorax sp.]|nr:hypothetical protein [Candidatus Chromulinivorax sp.]
MKQSMIVSLYFYFYLTISFAVTTISLDATLSNFTLQEQTQNRNLIDVYTTLHTIKKIHRDIENFHDQLPEEDQIIQQDCMTDIMIVLIGTYEKIIGATVTYYLMINVPIQQNLHQTIGMILAEDTVKIINILGKQFIHFMFNHHMTWQKKAWYCAWIISILVMIKIGIDQIPQSIKPQQQDIDFNLINDDKSSYLKDKFSNYR